MILSIKTTITSSLHAIQITTEFFATISHDSKKLKVLTQLPTSSRLGEWPISKSTTLMEILVSIFQSLSISATYDFLVTTSKHSSLYKNSLVIHATSQSLASSCLTSLKTTKLSYPWGGKPSPLHYKPCSYSLKHESVEVTINSSFNLSSSHGFIS